MSATGRSDKRNPSDFYETPEPLADAALALVRERFGVYTPALILDPGAGTGVWGRAAHSLWPEATVIGVDIERGRPPGGAYDIWFKDSYLDKARYWPKFMSRRPDLIIGNPPYRLSQQFIEASLSIVQPGGLVAFLLRLNFLAGECRRVFWQQNTPGRVIVCVQRPSFTSDNGTDATEYGVYVWSDRFHFGAQLEWLSWR